MWAYNKFKRLVLPVIYVLAVSYQVAAQGESPNVVLIISDDHGWPHYGFMASGQTLNTSSGSMAINQIVQTPSLDALAAEGVVFSNTHLTSSVCIESLRTLLSAAGLHPFQWSDKRSVLDSTSEIQLPQNAPYLFPRIEVEHFRTIAREFGAAGYVSWQGGKYWESTYDKGGFNDGMAVDDGAWIAPRGSDFGRTGWDPTSCGPTGDPAIECPALEPLRSFLDVNQEAPFLVWFAPQIPHSPYDAPQNFRQPYEQMGLVTCDVNPKCPADCRLCASEVNYLSSVSWLDSLVGELVNELESRGLRENTLLIYLADNGWDLPVQLYAATGKGKGTLYEMGFRTPMIFSWPGRIPQGVMHDDLVSSTDVAPTLFDYIGIDPLPEQQGLSLKPRLEGGDPVERDHIIGFTEMAGHFLRTDTWRYLRFVEDGREELYQIDIDPFEETDVAGDNPELVAGFSALVDAWDADRRAPPQRAEIAGRMMDATTGAPLTGAQLKLTSGSQELISIVGADGFFRFGPVNAGDYTLRPDRRTATLNWLGIEEAIPVTVPIAVSGSYLNVTGEPAAASLQTVDVPFGTQIRGRLETNEGQPLANVPITVQAAVGCDTVETLVYSQADGSYRAENLPFATYTLTAATPPQYKVVVADGVVVDQVGAVTQALVAYPADE